MRDKYRSLSEEEQKAKDYYKNNKERLKEQVRDKYRGLSEEEKNKKREYAARIGIIMCPKKTKKL